MRTHLTENRADTDNRVKDFFGKLNTFCRRYPHIWKLRISVETMTSHYTEPRMLDGQQNVFAAKCFFEEDYPKDLIHGIDLLFKGKGAALTGADGPAEYIIIKAILWIGKNIKAHTLALEALIEMDAWKELE